MLQRHLRLRSLAETPKQPSPGCVWHAEGLAYNGNPGRIGGHRRCCGRAHVEPARGHRLHLYREDIIGRAHLGTRKRREAFRITVRRCRPVFESLEYCIERGGRGHTFRMLLDCRGPPPGSGLPFLSPATFLRPSTHDWRTHRLVLATAGRHRLVTCL